MVQHHHWSIEHWAENYQILIQLSSPPTCCQFFQFKKKSKCSISFILTPLYIYPNKSVTEEHRVQGNTIFWMVNPVIAFDTSDSPPSAPSMCEAAV